MLARCSPAAAFPRRRRLAAAIGVTLLLSAFLNGTSAQAQTDLAAVAPWQLPPEMQSGNDAPRAVQRTEHGEAGPSGTCDGGSDCGGDCDVGSYCYPCDGWFWFRGDYLMWWGKSVHLPSLAANNLAGTSIIFGDQSVDQRLRSGGRFSLGGWLSECQETGIEVTYLFLGSSTVTFTQTSQDNPTLTRPFFNASTFRQDALVLAEPGVQSGSLSTSISNELQSVEALFRQVMFRQCGEEVDFLIGYRYGWLAEGLAVNSSTSIINKSPIEAGTVIAVSDLFDARNVFHGGELGIAAKSRYCRWSLEVLGKLALGSTQSRSIVSGSTTTTPSGGTPVVASGGFLALPTNSGTFQQTGFAVMPELGVTLGYDLTCRLKATCGYTLLYWSRVVRPADQVDTELNSTQFSSGRLQGFPAPQPQFVLTDYWAQGLALGLEYRF
jgi:hypothetical protein